MFMLWSWNYIPTSYLYPSLIWHTHTTGCEARSIQCVSYVALSVLLVSLTVALPPPMQCWPVLKCCCRQWWVCHLLLERRWWVWHLLLERWWWVWHLLLENLLGCRVLREEFVYKKWLLCCIDGVMCLKMSHYRDPRISAGMTSMWTQHCVNWGTLPS